MTKSKELETWKSVADAMFRFIQKHPPKGFNTYGLILFAQTGRYEELVKLLDEWKPEEAKETSNESN